MFSFQGYFSWRIPEFFASFCWTWRLFFTKNALSVVFLSQYKHNCCNRYILWDIKPILKKQIIYQFMIKLHSNICCGPYYCIDYSSINQETFLWLPWFCLGMKLVYKIRLNYTVFHFSYFGLKKALPNHKFLSPSKDSS